jgi:cytochrome c oxidase subunit II
VRTGTDDAFHEASLGGLAAAAAGTLTAGAAAAQVAIEGLEIKGAPVPGGIGFQPAATELARDIHWLDGMLLVIITAISLFVLALLAWVIVRFNRRANPTPARFTHNQPLEVAWTVIPIIILVFIGAFSLPVLFKQLEIPEGDVTIKVTGYQWYWGYEYVDDGFDFASFMLRATNCRARLSRGHLPPGHRHGDGRADRQGHRGADHRRRRDPQLVRPGLRREAGRGPGPPDREVVPVERGEEGIYFGQCSELCGKDHAYMPITVKAVTPEEYDRWLEGAREAAAGPFRAPSTWPRTTDRVGEPVTERGRPDA